MNTDHKPRLLVLVHLPDASRRTLEATFDCLHAADRESLERAIAEQGQEIRLALTNGSVGLSATDMQRLPALELIGAQGVGYENVDIEAARARGIRVTNGSGTNDDCVADHALALMLATVREIPAMDRACRAGVWRDDLPINTGFSGKRLGIIGLGKIGQKVARRSLGFDLQIGYHNRNPVADSPYRYFGELLALADWSDYLLVATPGGAQTRHLIDANVLQALGKRGYLFNVARGSVVDTEALALALRNSTIAGAGLDVYEGEPEPPAALLDLDNIVLTPHLGGRSPEAIANTVKLFIDNAQRFLDGQPLLTPVV